MMRQQSKLLIPAMMLVLLTACGERVSEVEARMEQIRNEPAGSIEPPPVPEPIQEFEYTANSMRNPFLPQSLLLMQTKAKETVGVRPDTTRLKQPLENYELAELVYRGRVKVPGVNDEYYGLIQLPDGMVREVKKGDYMGKNFGKVLEITETQINIEEIVPDPQAMFVYKLNTLVTPN